MHRAFASVLVVGLVACGGQETVDETGDPSSAATPAPSEPGSVICDAFAEGGSVDLTTDAVIGNLQGENIAATAREAISAYEDLAEQASGAERDDLLAIAAAMDDAEINGAGVLGWNDASEAFYVKYAEQCGAEIAD